MEEGKKETTFYKNKEVIRRTWEKKNVIDNTPKSIVTYFFNAASEFCFSKIDGVTVNDVIENVRTLPCPKKWQS